jgi:isopentenyl diphosphate isomerase/L-lactate dehydrogenase-like FMN-dependent dehydrogenase
MTRREAFRGLAGFLAGSPLARSQRDLRDTGERIPSLEELVNVFEFEPVCKARIPKQNYDFIAGGVDNEWSLRNNRGAFDRITFRPRMLVNASNLDLSLELFGTRVSFPVLIAPTSAHSLAHPEAELATARAAASVETIHILSAASSQPLEKVAEATRFPKWFQLYPGPDLDGTWERIERARSAGYGVLTLTVDAPYSSHRERLLRNRVSGQVPSGATSGGLAGRRRVRPDETPTSRASYYSLGTQLIHQLDWGFFDELKKRWNGPVLIKGILAPDDAVLSIKHGADGIVVSNHGARYLEYAPATIEVLPEIVRVVNQRIPVLIDSGFRRGTDVLKALAIGATAVCVGRPPLWGLGAYGEAGCRRVLELLRTELALAMGLCGKANLRQLERSLVTIRP